MEPFPEYNIFISYFGLVSSYLFKKYVLWLDCPLTQMCRLVEVIPSEDTTFVFFVPFIVLNNTKGEIVANGHCCLFYLSFSRVAGGWVGSDMSITCVGGRRYLIDI